MPEDVKEAISEAAKNVYAELQGGYHESVYQQAMAIEFREMGIAYDVEHSREVFYKGQRVGEQRLDFLVLDDVVLELKAVDKVTNAMKAQLRSYLRTTGTESGILLNFPNEGEAPTIEPVQI